MNHSDVQDNFSTGAKRDTQQGKLRYDLISPLALTRLAEIYTQGAEHYGDRNWEKGMPFTRVLASLERHLMAFKLGKVDEDHLAQMVWNGFALLHFQEQIANGHLPATLDDTPNYASKYELPQETPQDFVEQAIQDSTCEQFVFNNPKRQGLYEHLFILGCPAKVAEQIVGGTTFSDGELLREDTEAHRPFVYIAGPMRGYESFNFPAFDKARDTFLGMGFNVISPADIDRYGNPNASDTAQDVNDQTVFVLRDFWSNFFIAKEGHEQGGIVLLPGWTKSVGASGEFFLTQWLKLRAYKPYGGDYYNAKHEFALANALATPILSI